MAHHKVGLLFFPMKWLNIDMTNQKDEIKSKLSVVEVVGEYVQLKKLSNSTFRGLCPFHNEKSPSFMVSEDKQIYHCFGCGAGGDMFRFIEKIENVEFIEALKILAKKANIELTFEKSKHSKEEKSRKEILKELLDLSCNYYNYILLNKEEGKEVLNYLKKRGLDESDIKKFRLGSSPNLWGSLYNFLKSRNYKDEDMFLAGLIIKNNSGSYYDRFRNRVMYSIFDTHGDVVGFGARILSDNKNEPKYINSPQTEVYDKSSILFGLNFAKQDIQKKKFAIIVEGYMDCITCHKYGFENVVASSGTALTEGQVKLLKRYTSDVYFCFDSDLAGINATERGIDVALENEINLKIISLRNTKYKDPDECIKNDIKEWEKAIDNALPFLDFYFNELESDVKNKTNPKELREKTNIFLEKLSKIKSKVEIDLWTKKIARLIDVDQSIINDELKSINANKNKIVRTNVGVKTVAQQAPQIDKIDTIQHQTEEVLIASILENIKLAPILSKLNLDIFEDQNLKDIASSIVKCYNDGISGNEIISCITANEQNQEHLNYLLMLGEKISSNKFFSLRDIKKDVKNNILKLYKKLINSELKEIKKQISLAEKEKNVDQINSLENKLLQKIEELKKIEKSLTN